MSVKSDMDNRLRSPDPSTIYQNMNLWFRVSSYKFNSRFIFSMLCLIQKLIGYVKYMSSTLLIAGQKNSTVCPVLDTFLMTLDL